MIAKLPMLGVTLVTALALADQAAAHEGCPDAAPAPTTYRGPTPSNHSAPVGYPGYRADGYHARQYEDYRADLEDLRQSDGNRDGRVTLAEALRNGRRDFRRTDRDQNRVLTRHELSRRDLAYEDRNRNGRVSYGEYQNAVRRAFARFDTNRDGVLAGYELTGSNGARSAGWWR